LARFGSGQEDINTEKIASAAEASIGSLLRSLPDGQIALRAMH
jgi:hypothetical protein